MMVRRTPSHRIGRVRVASWNLQKLSLEKIRNPGVREVICMTLLENGYVCKLQHSLNICSFFAFFF